MSPFVGEDDNETHNNVNQAIFTYNYSSFDDVSQQAKDFISNLLIPDPHQRLTAASALNSTWLTFNSNIMDGKINKDVELSITKAKLKRYVIKKRWVKAVNTLIFLRRMGAKLDCDSP